MATKINPPALTKGKSYELYKQELLAWNEITDLHKTKRGVAIALTLPESDKHRIREKVFDQIDIEDLKKENGFQTLVTFLDKHLEKDDLVDSLEKFEEFEDFERGDDQTINDFIAEFDSKYRKIEKKNMKLPHEILAFKLLRKAKITKEEKMIVLTGMNFENRITLYEEAKRSLKKFKGEGAHAKSGNVPANIKLEPAFLAENEEALWAAGYVKRPFQNTRRGGRSMRGSFNNGFQSSQRGVKKLNPTGADGKVLTCRSCGSYRHLVAKCPDSWENLAKINITEEEEEHAVLFTGYHKEEIRQLGADARNCAVLDSACSSTVCGKTWFGTYMESLSEDERNNVISRDGRKVFKFGGGTKLKSDGEYEVPMYMVGKKVTVKTDVVDSDIPLLLSRSTMKKAGVKMDLENDTAIIMGEEIALNLTASGHYCIPVDKTETMPVEEINAVNIEGLNDKEQKAVLLKLHRQFAHPSKKKLEALLKDAGAWQEQYETTLTDIESTCELCKMYAKTPPRPVVALPMAHEFNEKVAMDLKQYEGLWILHMIDMWSRYTVSIFIKRKRPKDVIDGMMRHWVGVFGVMGALFTDNGGEFNSDEMREVASILNIRVCTTAGMSPFQNGLCERVHAVTDRMLVKLAAENKGVELETLLAWANMARNSLQMWNGFSSHQLVFGTNPNLPNVVQAELPALEGTTTSEAFAKHLNTLYETRKAYIKTEADERIRRALRTKVRATEQVFENGDKVFYKREGKERWLGPGTVVFQDGKVVFVRHGGVFVRVSPNRLNKAKVCFESKKDKSNSGQEIDGEENDRIYIETPNIEDTTKPQAFSEIQDDTVIADPNGTTYSSVKTGDMIRYKMTMLDKWNDATILSRAGKCTGKNKMWYNLQDKETDEQKSVNLDSVVWEKVDNETSEEGQVNISELRYQQEKPKQDCDSDSEVLEAKQSELQKLCQFNTYEEVEDHGQKTISTRWILSEKDGKVRARLVARGFEERLFIPSDSPTVGKGALRIVLTVAAYKVWKIKTTDIKSAFLQGKQLDREVYVKPPSESNTPSGMVWKLRHGLYGLKDGARQFYLTVREELIRLGCEQSKLDPAVFTLMENGDMQGIICCHVDDFFHAGNEIFEKMLCRLRTRFLAGKVEEANFKYIGFQIKQNSNGIHLDHSEYMDKLEHSRIDSVRASDRKSTLTEEEQSLYRMLVGQINWAVQGSRPDLAFELVDLSTRLAEASVSDLLRAIKVHGRLKDISPILFFPHLEGIPTNDWEIILFSDAALGNINDGKGSTGAHIIWIKDRLGNCCPVCWKSNKIKRVVRSTLAAEALSLQEGLETAIYYRAVIKDIGIGDDIPITAFVDNKSVVDAIHSTKLVEDKRLRIDIAAILEMTLKNSVHVKWCPGKLQLANTMTKRGASGLELLKVLQCGKMPEEFM